MNLQQIRYVITAAKCGSFSNAAKELYITEATISQQIKKLEQELEVELFSRSTRKISLTEAGKLFVKRAITVMDAYEKLTQSMEQFAHASKRVFNVGMTPAMEALGLSRFAASFGMEHREADIRLYTAQIEQLKGGLLENRIDLAVMRLSERELAGFDEKKFCWKSLLSEKMFLVAPKGRFEDKPEGSALCDIADIPVICEPEGSAMYQSMKDYFEENGLTLHISLRTNYAESMFAAVEAGHGIAFASSSICQYYANRYSFCATPVKPVLENHIYAIYLREKGLSRWREVFLLSLGQAMQSSEGAC